jgi:hypothetical protein
MSVFIRVEKFVFHKSLIDHCFDDDEDLTTVQFPLKRKEKATKTLLLSLQLLLLLLLYRGMICKNGKTHKKQNFYIHQTKKHGSDFISHPRISDFCFRLFLVIHFLKQGNTQEFQFLSLI